MKRLFLGMFLIALVALSGCATIDSLFGNDTDTPVIDSDLLLGKPYIFTNTSEPSDLNNDSLLNDTVIDMNDSSEADDEEPVSEENVSEDTDMSSQDGDYLASIEIVEGEAVSLNQFEADDPDGDSISYSYSEPFSADGEWVTADGDAGTYVVSVTATDGFLSTTQDVQVIVLPSNKGPVINCPSLLTVSEGDFVEVPCTIDDKEGDDVNYVVSGFKERLQFDVGYDDAGEKKLLITATDGQKVTSKEITLVVENTNRLPQAVQPGLIRVVEGETVALDIETSDPDGDTVRITYPSQFTDEGVWETARGDAGTYELEATISDGEDSVAVPVNVIVEKLNVAPVIKAIDPIEVDEGDLITLPIEITDADGDDIEVTISGFMTEQEYQTTYDDAGEHLVTITATDGQHTVSTDVQITVNNVNRAPVFVTE